VDGTVLEAFGASPKTQSGMQIAGRRGQPVRAASGGQVVYAGSGLQTYGQLVIIKHNATYLSAYGYNEALLVSEGQQVTGGQQIARLGEGPGRKPMLHFEIRRNGQPVNPLAFLPSR
jgi:lipoprotein NlpD